MRRDDRWMRFHDGELDAEGEAAVRDELRRDSRARAQVEALRRIGDLVREAHQTAAPDLTEQILARVANSNPMRGLPSKTSGGRRVVKPALGLGALALAAAVALLVAEQRREVRPDSNDLLAYDLTPAVPSVSAVALYEAVQTGVSIQSVDFGPTPGAIFMVSGAEQETMVVWTLEDTNDKG